MNRLNQIKNDIGYLLWAIGITGWIKAVRDVSRDRKRRTVKVAAVEETKGGIM